MGIVVRTGRERGREGRERDIWIGKIAERIACFFTRE